MRIELSCLYIDNKGQLQEEFANMYFEVEGIYFCPIFKEFEFLIIYKQP
jgi:hypothetical protein